MGQTCAQNKGPLEEVTLETPVGAKLKAAAEEIGQEGQNEGVVSCDGVVRKVRTVTAKEMVDFLRQGSRSKSVKECKTKTSAGAKLSWNHDTRLKS